MKKYFKIISNYNRNINNEYLKIYHLLKKNTEIITVDLKKKSICFSKE